MHNLDLSELICNIFFKHYLFSIKGILTHVLISCLFIIYSIILLLTSIHISVNNE